MDRFTLFATLVGYIGIALGIIIGIFIAYASLWVLVFVYRVIKYFLVNEKSTGLSRAFERALKHQTSRHSLYQLK